MCLLILKLEDTALPLDHARSAAYSNDDGFGVAWHDGRQWQVHRTMDLLEHLRVLPEAMAYRALVHYRMATHGTKTVDNVHPFLVGAPDDPHAFVVAHNGMFSSMPRDATRSDTRLMAEHVFAQLKPGWENDEVLCGQLSELFGYNRVAVLFADGRYLLFGEKSGHWNASDDIWYSNYSYNHSRGAYTASNITVHHGASTPRALPASTSTTPPTGRSLPAGSLTDPTSALHAANLEAAVVQQLDSSVVAYVSTHRGQVLYALCQSCTRTRPEDVWALDAVTLATVRGSWNIQQQTCDQCRHSLRYLATQHVREFVRLATVGQPTQPLVTTDLQPNYD